MSTIWQCPATKHQQHNQIYKGTSESFDLSILKLDERMLKRSVCSSPLILLIFSCQFIKQNPPKLGFWKRWLTESTIHGCHMLSYGALFGLSEAQSFRHFFCSHTHIHTLNSFEERVQWIGDNFNGFSVQIWPFLYPFVIYPEDSHKSLNPSSLVL